MNEPFVLDSPSDLPIHVRGPKISEGPLPAFFYFALSGEDSLSLDPYNQPVAFLDGSNIRCFSFTLPFHGPGYDNNNAIDLWMQELNDNPQFLDIFFQKCVSNINYLLQQGIVNAKKMAVGGLSRGAFIAAHLAARDPRLQYILGFAPMTKLKQPWDLDLLIDKIVNKQVRFYIGNRDTRVGTQACFDFIHRLADAAYHHGHRSPPIELMINPSVGFKGHGTLPPVFKSGADWLRQKLLM
jgi:hypothetical protein